MTDPTPWRDALAATIDPEKLRRYLERTGWRLWPVETEQVRLFEWRGWQLRPHKLADALRVLESAENRNPADIAADIARDGAPAPTTLPIGENGLPQAPPEVQATAEPVKEEGQ